MPLIIQDRFFADDGSFRLADPGIRRVFGDVLLVNGRPHPIFEVEQRACRFRVFNGSSLDGFQDLLLDIGGPFHLIGTDGGLLPARSNCGGCRSHRPNGPRSSSTSPSTTSARTWCCPATRHLVPLGDVLRFDVTRPLRQRRMLIDGKEFDPDRIDIRPRLGHTEIWTVVNGERQELPIPHVFHTHRRFQILDRAARRRCRTRPAGRTASPSPPANGTS